MSDLEKIFLTSGLTVLGGVIVFVVGQLINELIIKPFMSYRKLIGDIDEELIFFSNIYTNAGSHNINNSKAEEASSRLRRLSCRLRTTYSSLSWIRPIQSWHLMISEPEKEKVASNLIRLSNALWGDYIGSNIKASEEIAKILNLNKR